VAAALRHAGEAPGPDVGGVRVEDRDEGRV
jgi:hypothetical protein